KAREVEELFESRLCINNSQLNYGNYGQKVPEHRNQKSRLQSEEISKKAPHKITNNTARHIYAEVQPEDFRPVFRLRDPGHSGHHHCEGRHREATFYE